MDSTYTSAPDTYTSPDSVYVEIIDSTLNTDTSSQQTVIVTVSNLTTGEAETFTLTEAANDSANFRFAFTVASSPVDTSAFNGWIYAVEPNDLQVVYGTKSDSVRIDTPTPPPPPPALGDTSALFSNSTYSSSPDTYTSPDSAYLEVIDLTLNTDTTSAETVAVTLTNLTSGEVETIILTEAANDTPNFRIALSISNNVNDSGSGDGTMYAINADIVQVSYCSRSDTALITAADLPNSDTRISFVNMPFLTAVDTYTSPDSAYIEVEDTSANMNSGSIETVVVVTLTNLNTGENETVSLTEVWANTRFFRDTVAISNNVNDSASGNGIIYAINGHILQIVNGTKNDTVLITAAVPSSTDSSALFMD